MFVIGILSSKANVFKSRVLVELTQIRNDQVQSVVTTCWLADNIYQFTVMDRADVYIVEVTTGHEVTVQVFAFEDGYRVCNVLQQPLPCARLGWIIDSSYNDARYFTGQSTPYSKANTRYRMRCSIEPM